MKRIQKGIRTPSLTVSAVALVAVIAVLAGGTLWVVRRMQHHLARAEAARAVITEGESILNYLVHQPAVTGSLERALSWSDFSDVVNSMHTLQGSLQYVAVRKGGVTVFHEQATRGSVHAAKSPATPLLTGRVNLARRVLQVGEEAVPVVAFTQSFTTSEGRDGVVEAAFRVDAVSREERAATSAIGSMFQLSLATVLGAFGICAVLVLWVMRREAVHERVRREQEHLAFSGVLANGIAHDFRNPMSSLRLDVQMLARQAAKPEVDTAKLRGLADRIRGTLDRMDKVFQEFLYLSRPPSENQEQVDVIECVRDCVALLEPRFERSQREVRYDLPEGPVTVLGLSGALRRAVVNVLTNAEQFAPAGTPIDVRVRRAGGRAILDIEDQGPGIPADERRRIFDMFATTRPEGTGIGLFLAKTAVERSGGDIAAVDGQGTGACLRIRLPLATASRSEEDE